MAEALTDPIPTIATPGEIFNCPNCSVWLQPGTLVCADCETIVYSQHLREIALAATNEENAGNWLPARATWEQALAWLPPATKQYIAVEQRIALIDQKMKVEQDRKANWTRRLGPFAPVLLFLSKLKGLLFVLLKFKFILSFVGFFALYWAAFGWQFALGFSVAILVHEMGHYVAAKRRGLKVDLPVFLPGLGAYVRWYSMGISLDDLSGIALAGPFFGLIMSVVFGAIARLLHDPYAAGLFSALAHVSAWLNLMNLIPVFGLDGAQATYALNRMQRWLVTATALIFFGLLQEWMFLAVAVGMGWRLWSGGYPDKPSSKTMVQFVLLLFALGVVVYIFPAAALDRR